MFFTTHKSGCPAFLAMKMFAGLMSRWTMPAQGENSMQADLVSFGIDLFDLDDDVQGAAQD